MGKEKKERNIISKTFILAMKKKKESERGTLHIYTGSRGRVKTETYRERQTSNYHYYLHNKMQRFHCVSLKHEYKGFWSVLDIVRRRETETDTARETETETARETDT